METDELDGSVPLATDVDVTCNSVSNVLLLISKYLFETQDWAYQMRRQMQEIVPGLFLGPYAAAMKQQVSMWSYFHSLC